jgi:predicted nucleotidyltransferase
MGFSILLEEREKRKERRRSMALQEAKRLSHLLGQRFPYERLYLFGSALRGGGFSGHSDIDLVIKGLDGDLFLKVYAFLIKESDFSIDLKPWELLDGQIREKVEREGLVLYEKGQVDRFGDRLGD